VREALSVDLRRTRSVGQLLWLTAALYRRYPVLFFLLAFAVVAPYDLAILAVGYGPLARLARNSQAIYWANLIVRIGLVNSLIGALHIHAVAMAGTGARPRLKRVARRGLAVLSVVGAVSLLAFLGAAAGLLIFVIPGVLLWLGWAIAPQAAAIENAGVLAAMRRSRELARGSYRHVLGVGIVLVLVDVGIIELARAIPLGSTSGVASVSVGVVLEAVVSSFSALVMALLYFDLMARYRERDVTSA
jgi:hypothetical protein